MLDGIRPGERFYDLGCGDGRLVIAAAQMGAIAVGIDDHQERLALARANVLAAGVVAEIRAGDLFEVSLTDADFVTAYL